MVMVMVVLQGAVVVHRRDAIDVAAASRGGPGQRARLSTTALSDSRSRSSRGAMPLLNIKQYDGKCGRRNRVSDK
jgi:hypothetical protein